MIDTTIYDKITHFAAYQERCVSDIKLKLYKLKVEKENYTLYIDKLVDDNYLNEDRYVKYYVAAHVKKKWGKAKMKSELMGKRINPEIIKVYLDDMDTEEYDLQIKAVAEKKWPSIKGKTLRDRKTKLMRFLLGKGYEMDKVIRYIKDVE